MTRLFTKMILLLSLMVAVDAFAKSVVEAKKKGVKVYAKADKKSDVISKMKKGEQLPASDRSGMYWQVTLSSGETGFVSVLKVKRKSIEDDGLASALRKAVQKERHTGDAQNARARSAVMGVRGLDESKDLDFVGNVKPNLRMVYTMENFVVSNQQIENLGEKVFGEVEKRVKRKK